MCGLIKDVKERVNAKYNSNFVFQNNFTVGSYKFTWEKHVASSGLSTRAGDWNVSDSPAHDNPERNTCI